MASVAILELEVMWALNHEICHPNVFLTPVVYLVRYSDGSLTIFVIANNVLLLKVVALRILKLHQVYLKVVFLGPYCLFYM